MPRVNDLVFVEWIDSRTPTAKWQHRWEVDFGHTSHCVTVGFLVHKGRRAISVSQTLGNLDSPSDIHFLGVIHIPVGCIVKMTVLKEPVITPHSPRPRGASKRSVRGD